MHQIIFFSTYALQHERANQNSTSVFLKTLLSPIRGLNFYISLARRTSGRGLGNVSHFCLVFTFSYTFAVSDFSISRFPVAFKSSKSVLCFQSCSHYEHDFKKRVPSYPDPTSGTSGCAHLYNFLQNRGNMVVEGENTAQSTLPVVWRQTRYQEVGWVIYRFNFELCEGLRRVQNNHTSCAAWKRRIRLYIT